VLFLNGTEAFFPCRATSWHFYLWTPAGNAQQPLRMHMCSTKQQQQPLYHWRAIFQSHYKRMHVHSSPPLATSLMSDDDSFADGIRDLLRNHNLSSSSFIRFGICNMISQFEP
jgi:hypothetical protein